MRSLSVEEIIRLHEMIVDASGGSQGVRDAGAIEFAVAQPQMGFGGDDLYPTLAENAAALSFSLINNPPLVDGNERIGYEAAVVFLDMNGFTISGDIDEKERVILAVASGEMARDEWTNWPSAHLISHASVEQ